MNVNSKIYVAGHNGLVGSAIVREMSKCGFENIIKRNFSELDLRNQKDVLEFFETEKPEYVFLAAAKVGGIAANIESPAEFMYDNLVIQNNIIDSAYKTGVKKLLFLGSSCIYPRLCPQPMKEEYLLSGVVEPTNEGYALAKIIGLKLCEMYNRQYGTDYISVMPCNVYGQGDSFNLENSHVVAALMRKFHEAKENASDSVLVWGTGEARRELLYVDDLAEACVFLMNTYSGNEFLNIGTGFDVSIAELANIIKEVVGYQGNIVYDKSKPDGMPQKLMNISKATERGWSAKIDITEGIVKMYSWYISQLK